MNTNDMLQCVQRHPICCELGVELQWGMPYYRLVNDKLFARFHLFILKADPQVVSFYQPVYILEFAYPFRHLSRFENLCYQMTEGAGEMVCQVSVSDFAEAYLPAFNRLCRMSDQLLDANARKRLYGAQTTAYRQSLIAELRRLRIDKGYALEV